LTLQGASVVGERGLQKAAKALTASTSQAKNTTFEDPLPGVLGLFMNGTLTVLPSALESVIDTPYLLVGSASYAYPTTFDVQEGAVLRLRASLADDLSSHDGSSTNRVRSGFLKTGQGTLILTQPSALSGTVVIQDGTGRLGKIRGFRERATDRWRKMRKSSWLTAPCSRPMGASRSGQRFCRTRRSMWTRWRTRRRRGRPSILAQLWNRRRRLYASGGKHVRRVQADAFGAGRPGLSLGSGSAYRLTGFYEHRSANHRLHGDEADGQGSMGGPYSFSSLSATNGDNKAGIRAWYLENSATNTSGNINYMDVRTMPIQWFSVTACSLGTRLSWP
jgi:autotransporter-associated beta strand protein